MFPLSTQGQQQSAMDENMGELGDEAMRELRLFFPGFDKLPFAAKNIAKTCFVRGYQTGYCAGMPDIE